MKSIAQKAAEYANNLCFSKESMQYLSKEDFEMTFKDGAQYALEHQWISVDDDLPYKHKELLNSETGTVRVNIINEWGHIELVIMLFYEDEWHWSNESLNEVRYWMPIPKLTK